MGGVAEQREDLGAGVGVSLIGGRKWEAGDTYGRVIFDILWEGRRLELECVAGNARSLSALLVVASMPKLRATGGGGACNVSCCRINASAAGRMY